jgi:hypothetical protein
VTDDVVGDGSPVADEASVTDGSVPQETVVDGQAPVADDSALTEYGETWVYESLLGALPGLSLSERAAIAIQVGIFGAGVVVLGLLYGVERAIVPGLVAVGVAGAGSLAMLRFSRGVRRLDPPRSYQRVLFGSNIEVVLGVFAFSALIVYLFVVESVASNGSLLVSLLGDPLPILPTYLALLVLWDLCYRIGTSWWAAVAALWRARTVTLDGATAREYRRLDVLNIGFALVQLALVPFVLDRPLLLVAVSGHILAVAVVETVAIVLQR